MAEHLARARPDVYIDAAITVAHLWFMAIASITQLLTELNRTYSYGKTQY